MPSHVLIAVTGMTPQVVTETLYGLAEKAAPWPEQVKIITTRKGADVVARGLFDEGHLAALSRELGRPTLNRDNVEILIVPDADGQPVDDARTVEDHEALADFIMDTVRQLTADDDRVVHASIAGGRKTMTFYLGYAMSLFGRPQDRMSHVLVSEGYEGLPDFYYPTRELREMHDRFGNVLDARDARVSLADIPFIRQRDQLPDMLRNQGKGVSFRKLVDLINLGTHPQEIRLELHDAAMRLDIFEQQRLVESITFNSRFDWSWYQVVAEATRQLDSSLRRRVNEEEGGHALGWRMLNQLSRSLRLPLDHPDDYRGQLRDWLDGHEATLEASGIRLGDFESSMWFGLDVSQATHRINRRLKEALPEGLASYLKIEQMFDPRTGEHRGRRTRGGGYAINLSPRQIRGVQ